MHLLAGWAALLAIGCAHAPAVSGRGAFRQRGLASIYANALAGHRTADGERYRPDALTAAHRSLPFGTEVLVTALPSGRSVIVRVNDRGPYRGGRIIDLSAAAARRLGFADGVFAVELRAPP